MKIVFRPAARDDLEKISAWIAADNPNAAFKMVASIKEKVFRLAARELSYMGHPGVVQDTLELVVYPYIIVYKVFEKRREIVILSIVHGAQNR